MGEVEVREDAEGCCPMVAGGFAEGVVRVGETVAGAGLAAGLSQFGGQFECGVMVDKRVVVMAGGVLDSADALVCLDLGRLVAGSQRDGQRLLGQRVPQRLARCPRTPGGCARRTCATPRRPCPAAGRPAPPR
ncbi:hypothetical protein [Kibdelosporangium phytohabitans]|uniref:hypothetical protein n=1 Tax=Kibdelosporangium phytohabitans TaxID=860235 RepID=UPI0012FA0F0B|nr:hypothetical protein [Kibdelosporangium phytohabitans]MBE1463307.1 hypothetical protein [Kibdelosporangium phytohabitans]